MVKKPELTQELIREHFEYREDGHLYRRITTAAKTAEVGMKAGYQNARGYIIINVKSWPFRAHRLVFLYHHGYMPEFVDHINGRFNDNRIENLREVTHAQNMQNRIVNKSVKAKSKYKCIHWRADRRRWVATFRVNGNWHYVGMYVTEEEAYEAYLKAVGEVAGEFAVHNSRSIGGNIT